MSEDESPQPDGLQQIDSPERLSELVHELQMQKAALASAHAEAIEERNRLATSLDHQRELLQRIFDNIPVLLVMWDPRLKRFTLNPQAEKVLGWSTEEANDGDFLSKAYPDPDYRAEVVEFMQSLEPGWREWNITAKDGRIIPSEWANFRLADDTMIGISVDLRERKLAEEELHQRLEELRAANDELSRFNRAAVDRELRMIELKKEINALHAELGRPRRYPLEFEEQENT